jgi:hypothetical protein
MPWRKGLRPKDPPAEGLRGDEVMPGPEPIVCEPGDGLEGEEGVEKDRLPRLPVDRPPPARAHAADSRTRKETNQAATAAAGIISTLLNTILT